MEGTRFDGLTRGLVAGASRRRALMGMVGTAVAGLLAHLGIEEAAAACIKPGKKGCKGPDNGKCCNGARCRGGSNDKPGRCVCKGGLIKCGTRCVTANSNAHCGTCNNACAAGTTCTNRQCPPCPKAQVCDFSAACGAAGSGCACFFTVEGGKACTTREFSCGEYPTCTASSQCGAGQACVATCCDGGRCAPLCGSGAGQATGARTAGQGPTSSRR